MVIVKEKQQDIIQSLCISKEKFEVVFREVFGVKVSVSKAPKEDGKGKREMGSTSSVETKENRIRVDMDKQQIKQTCEDSEDVDLIL